MEKVPVHIIITPTAQEFVTHPQQVEQIMDHIGRSLHDPTFTVGKSVVAYFTIEGKELAVALDNMEDGLHAVICTPDERRSFFKLNKPTHDGNHGGWTN